MCECLEHEDGGMYLCPVCTDKHRYDAAEIARLRARVAELEGAIRTHMHRSATMGVSPCDRELWGFLEDVRNVERLRRGERLVKEEVGGE